MSIMRIVTGCLTFVTLLTLAVPSPGQREIHHVPPLIHPDGENPDLAHPFIEPFTFNPDFQFFAPADFGTFGDGPDANTGFFATYDRLYIWVTRPEDQLAQVPYPGSQTQILEDPTGGDFSWGNRFDLGYMTEEDHGWLTSFWHIDGPNSFDELIIERVDVFEPEDEINNDPTSTQDLRGGGGGGGGQPSSLLGQPRRDANNAVTGARDFRTQNSINVADLTSWEFNKTFRYENLHYGSIVEPFFGFRYMKFQDYYRRDVYQRFDNTTAAALGPGLLPIPPTDVANFSIEDQQRTSGVFDNYMIGGQLGLRWFKKKGRWDLSSEVRAFAFQNFQSFHIQTDLERTFFDDVSVDADITTILFDRTQTAAHANEFVFGTEIRAEAAFAVSRDMSLRAGMAFMEFGRGIGRGNNIAANDQDLTMIGATFGFTVNR